MRGRGLHAVGKMIGEAGMGAFPRARMRSVNGKTRDVQSEAAHRAAATPVADPGVGFVVGGEGQAVGDGEGAIGLAGHRAGGGGGAAWGTQWAVSSALETTLTFAVSPLREDLRLVQADLRSVQVDIRSLSEGQAEIRGQLAVQGADVSALREEVRSVRADVRALGEGQADLRERLVRVETLLEPDGSSSDGDQRVGDVRPGVPGLGGTESHPG